VQSGLADLLVKQGKTFDTVCQYCHYVRDLSSHQNCTALRRRSL